MLIGVLAISTLTGCGSDSKEGKDSSVTEVKEDVTDVKEDVTDEKEEETESTDDEGVLAEKYEEDEKTNLVQSKDNKEGYYVQFTLATLAIENVKINDGVLEFCFVDTDFSDINNLVYEQKRFKMDEKCVFTSESEEGTVRYMNFQYVANRIDSVNEELDAMIKYGSTKEKVDECLRELFVIVGHYSDNYAVVDEVRVTHNYSKWKEYENTGLGNVNASSVALDYYRVEGEGDRTTSAEMTQAEIRTKELLLMAQNLFGDIVMESSCIKDIQNCSNWEDAYTIVLLEIFAASYGNSYEDVKEIYEEGGYPEVDINDLSDFEIGKNR